MAEKLQLVDVTEIGRRPRSGRHDSVVALLVGVEVVPTLPCSFLWSWSGIQGICPQKVFIGTGSKLAHPFD